MASDIWNQRVVDTNAFSRCAQFLAVEVDEHLGALFDEAETSFHEFPAHTLQLGRSCAELIAYKFLEAEDCPHEPDVSFYNILQYSPFDRSSRRGLRDGLHQLRIWGNRAAHRAEGKLNRDEVPKLAAEALELVYTLATEHLSIGDVHPPRFELPAEASTNRMCGDAVIRNDPHAQYRLGLRARRIADQALDNVLQQAREESSAMNFDLEGEDALYWFSKAAGVEGLGKTGLGFLREHSARFPEAWYELARLYLDGVGVERDVDLAVAIFETVAQWVPEAAAQVGIFGLTGEVTSSRGHTLAAYEGEGDPIVHLEYAATNAHPAALNALCAAYETGNRVEKNIERAVEYAQSAADAGFPLAKLNLAQFIASGMAEPRSPDELKELLSEAEEAGVSETYVLLFHLHEGGFAGFPENHDLAMEYLEQGCERRNARCLLAWVAWSAEQSERDLARESHYLRHVLDQRWAPSEEINEARSLLASTIDALREDIHRGIAHFERTPTESGWQELENKVASVGMLLEPEPDDEDSRWENVGSVPQFRARGGAKAQDAWRTVMTGNGFEGELREYLGLDPRPLNRDEALRHLTNLLPNFSEVRFRLFREEPSIQEQFRSPDTPG